MPDQLASSDPGPTPSPTATSARAPTSRRRCSRRSATTRSTRSSTRRCPTSIRERDAARAARAAVGDRGARRAARARATQRGAHVAHRPRLPRHDHAAGDPAQRAREPGLVHGVHAVPAGDLARAGSRRCSTSRRWSTDLTGMDLANASLLDEATAAAEAMAMLHRAERRRRGDVFFVDADCHPQTIEVVRDARRAARHRGRGRRSRRRRCRRRLLRRAVQYPGSSGGVRDLAPVDRARARRGRAGRASRPTCSRCALLTPPGEMGADVVVGSAQRFGVPLGFGGPHAAFLATRDEHKRTLPGPARRRVGRRAGPAPRSGSRCRRASSTSGARRRRATSAPRRCCSR